MMSALNLSPEDVDVHLLYETATFTTTLTCTPILHVCDLHCCEQIALKDIQLTVHLQ